MTPVAWPPHIKRKLMQQRALQTDFDYEPTWGLAGTDHDTGGPDGTDSSDVVQT